MCGINGLIEFKPKHSASEIATLLDKMNEQVYHRGPDDGGTFVSGGCGVAQRRLSIIDLSAGHQPMFNEDKSLALVFNGEIYNYRKLRLELIGCGHHFQTDSDTECILHAYEEYGIDSFARLDGMFALALMDIRKQQTVLARDRAGEKPLYYYQDDKQFIFASELKSMLVLPDFPRKISKEALHYYFTFQYIPAPLSIFENTHKLSAAHYLIVDWKNGAEEPRAYWDMVYDCGNEIGDYDECKSKLRETLTEAVASRMVSDVPVGAFLSGGIDSTIVSGLMSELSNGPINTFTIGFENQYYDERDRAEIAARAFGSYHHVEVLTEQKTWSLIEEILDKQDEPFADSSVLPTYFVSALSGQHVKCVLTGDGGDELFAGYSKYLIGYYSRLYNKIPIPLRKYGLETLVDLLPVDAPLRRKLGKVITNAKVSPYEQRLRLMQLCLHEDGYQGLMASAWRDEHKPNLVSQAYKRYAGRTDELGQALYTDFKIVLEGDMFTKVDRMSMLNSLETRTPMVSLSMLELAPRIPSRYKINHSDQKIILKDAFRDLIPAELLHKSKRGFAVPLDRWFRDGSSRLSASLDFEKLTTEGFLRPDMVQHIFAEHQAGQVNHAGTLWAIYVFERWLQKWGITAG